MTNQICFAALSALHHAAFGSMGRGWSAEEIAHLAETGVLIGDQHGFALFSVAADEAELLTIAVPAAGRRKGKARDLVKLGATRLREMGVRRLFLEVAEDNAPALALYCATGFSEISRRPRYYSRGDDRIDAIIMCRSPL